MRPIAKENTLLTQPESVLDAIAEQFWSHVDKHGPPSRVRTKCWNWIGALHGKRRTGYGWMHFGGSKRGFAHRVGGLAHRVAYVLSTRTPIPLEMLVRHRCDNQQCVRPSHLLLGTYRDNTNDAKRRGRLATRANGRAGTIPEATRRKLHIAQQRLWSDPEHRRRFSEMQRRVSNRPSTKRKKVANLMRPEVQAKRKLLQLAAVQSPEVRKKYSEAGYRRWARVRAGRIGNSPT